MVSLTSEIPMRTHKILRSRAAGHLTPNRSRWLLLVLLAGLLAACSPPAGAGLDVTPTTSLLVDATATVPPLTATTSLFVDSTATALPPTATTQAGDGPGGCVLGATFLGD